ncbi:cullin 1-related [Cryptosporidium bovis]|uniref:cullin 1-related n=1 Tax=Cryptosporidium bovis TaxID=310047 RepID=UPI00351AAAF4|nr:cullin 1-related [Cryptosporidium bovis]
MSFDRSAPDSLDFSPSKSDMGFEERWLVIKSEAIEPLESYLLTRIKKHDNTKSVFTAEEYSRIYTLIYNMCTQSQRNWSRQLYLKYSETLENFLREKVLVKLKGVPGPELISEFQLGWSNYSIYLHWMGRFFGYLNKYYLKISGEGDLMSKGINIFYDTIFLKIKDKLSISFCEAVESSRFGNKVVEDTNLKGVVSICLELSQKSNILGIYENEIENPLINSLCFHYKILADKWVKVDSLIEYLSHIQESLNSEQERCTNYLTDSTWKKFKKSLINIFLSEEVDIVISQQNSIKKLLFDNEFEQLKLLYSLLSSLSNGVQILSAQIKKYILECGQVIVDEFTKLICQRDNPDLETTIPSEGENDLSSGEVHQNCQYLSWIPQKCIKTPFRKNTQELLFVQTLMSLYDHLSYLLVDCFERDTLVQKTINESFEVIVNMDIGCHNQAQLICNYCDHLLRKESWTDNKSNNFSECEHFYVISTKIVELFSFIHFQDYFLEIYRYSLARRLLQSQNTNSEKEELTIISLLKNKCGAGFTSKLEGMVTDIQTNRELNKKYSSYLDVIFKAETENKEVEASGNNIPCDFNLIGDNSKFLNCSKNMEFYVSVLTSSNWPTFIYSDVVLPHTLKKYIDRFEEFYFTETDHRKLSWIHWYGQCVINYNKKDSKGTNYNYEITCNTIQACVLLLFNNNSLLPFNEIRSLLQIDSSILKKQIESLTASGVLVKKQMDESDKSLLTPEGSNFVLEVNPEFTCVSTNLTIKIPSQGETTIKDRIEEDRSHAIEAAIVRIMKLKGEMGRNELVSHVVSQLECIRPSTTIIMNKINYLIDREYLSMHEEDPSRYIYLS